MTDDGTGIADMDGFVATPLPMGGDVRGASSLFAGLSLTEQVLEDRLGEGTAGRFKEIQSRLGDAYNLFPMAGLHRHTLSLTNGKPDNTVRLTIPKDANLPVSAIIFGSEPIAIENGDALIGEIETRGAHLFAAQADASTQIEDLSHDQIVLNIEALVAHADAVNPPPSPVNISEMPSLGDMQAGLKALIERGPPVETDLPDAVVLENVTHLSPAMDGELSNVEKAIDRALAAIDRATAIVRSIKGETASQTVDVLPAVSDEIPVGQSLDRLDGFLATALSHIDRTSAIAHGLLQEAPVAEPEAKRIGLLAGWSIAKTLATIPGGLRRVGAAISRAVRTSGRGEARYAKWGLAGMAATTLALAAFTSLSPQLFPNQPASSSTSSEVVTQTIEIQASEVANPASDEIRTFLQTDDFFRQHPDLQSRTLRHLAQGNARLLSADLANVAYLANRAAGNLDAGMPYLQFANQVALANGLDNPTASRIRSDCDTLRCASDWSPAATQVAAHSPQTPSMASTELANAQIDSQFAVFTSTQPVMQPEAEALPIRRPVLSNQRRLIELGLLAA